MDTSVSAFLTTINVPPHTSEQNKSARSARRRLLKIFLYDHADQFLAPRLSLWAQRSNNECKHPTAARQDAANFGIGRDHRIPLAELACMSPKRRQELADRLGGKPGRAPRIKSAHVRRPLFRPGP